MICGTPLILGLNQDGRSSCVCGLFGPGSCEADAPKEEPRVMASVASAVASSPGRGGHSAPKGLYGSFQESGALITTGPPK